jgi:hypothetical protein
MAVIPRAVADCPSCHGTGWASLVVKGHCYAGGPCRCAGGLNWAGPPDDREGKGHAHHWGELGTAERTETVPERRG